MPVLQPAQRDLREPILLETPSAMLVSPVFFAATLPGEPEGEQGLRGGRARST